MTEAKNQDAPVLSLCMVSFNAREVLRDCLTSIYATAPDELFFEIIIVDNDSHDGSVEMLRHEFSDVHLIENRYNAGFSVATNQAMGLASGEYLLWLNTDTILNESSVLPLVRFLERHPRAGIVGPKVLNRDGSFQPQCRRGMPTPFAAFAYLCGLHRLFPNNPRCGRYLLTHLPVDQHAQVTSVSGAALLCRRAVWESVGPIDESIFAFGEDIDWCVRARQKGWEVWYCPDANLVHLGGQGGSGTRPFRRIRALHQAMRVFYDKHLSRERSCITNWLVRFGIGVSLGLNLVSGALKIVKDQLRTVS